MEQWVDGIMAEMGGGGLPEHGKVVFVNKFWIGELIFVSLIFIS